MKELLRKSLHLLALLLFPLYEILGKAALMKLIFISLLISLLLEILRIKKGWLFGFEKLARENERKSPGAHIYFLSSSLLIISLFSKEIALASIISFALSDASASLIGRSMGKRRIFRKTLEGTLSYFIVSSLIISFFFPLWLSLLSSLLGSLLELFDVPPNDNFSTPLGVAVLLFIGNSFL
ncbi:MAG: phosphatidate cytidylyltransferase [Archaeoglobi archaeon]|nr:phosphatidate cytidylyltransferase [Candidatus Mnemosynella bozhongmuii]